MPILEAKRDELNAICGRCRLTSAFLLLEMPKERRLHLSLVMMPLTELGKSAQELEFLELIKRMAKGRKFVQYLDYKYVGISI